MTRLVPSDLRVAQGNGPATDLHARLRLLVREWRSRTAKMGAGYSIFGRCATALEEVMQECGVEVEP